MKKILCFVIVTSFAFVLIACGQVDTNLTETPTNLQTTTEAEAITINVETNSMTLIEDETHQLVVTTNDVEGLIYSVDVAGIINLSDTGFITAVSEGSVMITLTSRSDSSIFEEINVVVKEAVDLVSNRIEVDLIEGESHQLVITSNKDYEFEVTNSNIISVSDNGLVLAKSEGEASVIVTSTYDPSVSISITFNVDKLITLDVNKSNYVLVVGDTESLDVESNDGLNYLSGDSNIVSVSETGELTAIGFGETTVTIRSTYNQDVEEVVTVTIYKYTEEISIEGNDLMIKGMALNLTIDPVPVGSFNDVNWYSSDESVLTVDEFGEVTAVNAGSATISAESTLDESIADTFNITVVDVLVVDESKVQGDTYQYESLELEFGEQLFNSISDALLVANVDTMIYIETGTYQEDIDVNVDGVELIGINENVIIDGLVNIIANNITLSNLIFESDARIENALPISNFVFENNTVRNVTHTNGYFINLDDSTNTSIINNSFTTINGDCIIINNVQGNLTEIEGNILNDCETAITIVATESLNETDEIRIFWNEITNIDLAFDINLSVETVEQDLYKVARFNKVTNFVNAVVVNEDSEFDFTLNYWGETELDFNQFTNVDPYYLKGNYTDALVIPTKTSYDPDLPIQINVLNPIDEIMIGETHTFEYEILPYELANAPIKFITGDPSIIMIDQTGLITPLSSGEVYIQVRSGQVSSIRTQTDFSVITTPGIEIMSSNNYNDIVVGDTFTLETILFPYTIEGESVNIVSDATGVATIDASGIVTTHSEGLVTFTASLDSDPSVSVDYTVYVHAALNPESSLLDYLTTQQITYSEIHKWTAYGFQYNYYDTRAESVSRYYFGDIPINDSKMLSVYYAIRPGEPMDPLPDGVTQYNPYNVQWVVVHDTASTATGSNALAHANYLYNNTLLENELWVSWHFTIDDQNIYQHIPEIERAFHAGDGSSSPGDSITYLGGGNRNGIGIEMSINEDGDLFRTWQRTAKLVTYLLIKYNLPIDHQAYHQDFSGKDCPRTLRNAGLVPLFEEFLATEYYIQMNFPDAEISMVSNDPEYLDDQGRIIQIPERAMTVSYTITVTNDGVTESRTFYTYLPGTVR
ncbi:MAG: Ig-like domain-containing protein [Tenericutes bacterium]|jgi:N-acetylmuramoyl-L-alanine amidase|nr:Ig-like domain-containing protein [Mycoplasmatota bacterium]